MKKRFLIVALMLLLTLFGCNRTHNDDLKDEYLVTFNYNYQDSPENYEVLVRSGEKVEKPSDPNRETHTFEGWFITEEEFDFETPI
ncbi:MAG: InlB B-repeat-containing protein, partial [Acholeplasmataceae bacterium]|nr:InlB B-repeat-containing protein [Acholeplasmataceae bacterium]